MLYHCFGDKKWEVLRLFFCILWDIYSWNKGCHTPIWGNRCESQFYASSGLKSTWNVPLIASQWNPTLPWPDFTSVKGVSRKSKTAAKVTLSPNLSPHFSQFSLILAIMHGVLTLACEGIQQSAIAGHMGLTRATVNAILQRHAATGTLVPCKFTRAPRKTMPHQDHALFGMVWQYCFISARDLTAWMTNLYGMRVGQKTINNQLLPHGFCAYMPTRKPLLTANHRHSLLEWTQRWQNLTMVSSTGTSSETP